MMKKYSGNGKPFVYGIFAEADRTEALAVLERISGEGSQVCYGENGRNGAEKKRLAKAAAAIVFVSSKAVEDEAYQEAVSAAVRGDRGILSIFLEETVLSEGLSMSLGSNQGIMKYAVSQEEFYEKLLTSPTLTGLTVTEEQKKAAKRVIAGAAAGIAALVAAAVFFLAPAVGGRKVSADSRLGQLGLSGSADGIRNVYLYGENLLDHYELSRGYNRVVEAEMVQTPVVTDTGMDMPAFDYSAQKIALVGSGEELPWGRLSDISDFSQLSNLEELCLAGNDIRDIAPLKGLRKLKLLDLTGSEWVDITSLPEFPALEVLNLSYCGFPDDPENPYNNTMFERSFQALLGCRTLKTLYVDDSMVKVSHAGPEAEENNSALAKALEEGGLPFEVIVVDRSAADWEELKAACGDENVYSINITGEIVIPEGEKLTIRSGVNLGGAFFDVENHGEIELYGIWDMGLTTRKNYGTIRVKDGGHYSGGMCDTENYGSFVVEEGGVFVMERGHSCRLEGGRFELEGNLIFLGGGEFRFEGGEFVNNGRVANYIPNLFNMECDFRALPGTGVYEEINIGEAADASGETETDRNAGDGTEEQDEGLEQGGEPEQDEGTEQDGEQDRDEGSEQGGEPGQDEETEGQGAETPGQDEVPGGEPSGQDDPSGCRCVACNCQDRNCTTPDCACDCVSCTTGVGSCTCGQ